MDVQIDIKKLLESLLLSKGKTVVDALKDQGLEWNGKEIVSIEPECIIEEGKWFMCLNNEGVEDEFTTGKVYHALRDNVLINDMREMSFWSNNTKRFRPATPEEISTIVDRPAAKEEIKKAHRNCNAPVRDNYNEIQQAEPEQEASEELTEFENEIAHILVYTNNEPTDTDEDRFKSYQKYAKRAKFFAPFVLDKARKKIASEILTKRNIDTYIGQVKNARETIPYSHQTLIWNVLADLEDDLVELKKIKEG